jgi:hypothetical protein
MGWNDAVKLCRAYGGEILRPASCAGIYRDFPDENIGRLVGEGTPIPIVAEWFAVLHGRAAGGADRHLS